MGDKKFNLCLLLVFLLYIFGCVPEAPRSNPLDPDLIDSESKANISGKVFTLYQPASPLKDVAVQLLPAGEIKLTGPDGFFQFGNLNPGTYQLIAQKENYLVDSLSVSILNNEKAEGISFFLNAIPQIENTTFYSQHIDQWWPGAIYHAFLTLVVSDSDGTADIDSLRFLIPALNFSKSFEPTTRPDSFFVDIENLELPQANLQYLIEQESFILLMDKGGAATTGGPYFLRRIIEETPQPLAPVNLQTVSPFPVLEWQTINLSFEFTYLVQVFRITGGIPVLIHTSGGILATQLTYNFPDSLTSGSYFWTIGVRDNLNDFSRSKEASFVVP